MCNARRRSVIGRCRHGPVPTPIVWGAAERIEERDETADQPRAPEADREEIGYRLDGVLPQ